MPRLDELALTKRRVKKLERDLKGLSDHVLAFLFWLDKEMVKPESRERGSRVAKASNALDRANDLIRYSVLGVNFRKDDKDKAALAVIRKFNKQEPAQNPPSQNEPGA